MAQLEIQVLAAVPPRSAEMPPGLQTFLIIATLLGAASVLVWGLAELYRRRDPMPLLVLLGTQLATPYESLGDALLHVYYPENGQVGWLHAFDRDIPLFVQLLYVPYVVPFVVLFVRALRSRLSFRAWWLVWAAMLGATLTMEIVVLMFGEAWVYYGAQQFLVGGIPVWVALTNVTFLFAISGGVYLITDRVPRKHWWLIAPATAVLLTLGHAIVAAPTGLALEQDGSAGAVRLGMGLSVIIAVGACWLLRVAVDAGSRSAPHSGTRTGRTGDSATLGR